VSLLGNLLKEFDFKQPPRPPLLLNPHPPMNVSYMKIPGEHG
jgi:hypothetical protein